MRIPPQSSNSTYFSGTPVSVISITSRRQQFAWQVAQVTSSPGKFIASIFIVYPVSPTSNWRVVCLFAALNR
jgi:hypothetical protein